MTILAQGGPLHGSNGIIFGPDGLLYIASVSSSAIAGIDPETGTVVHRWGLEEGITGPDDLIFGPDGSLFWTDISTGDVGRRAPDGTTRVIASPGPGVNPITFSDDGRLFVAQCFLDDQLFEIDPDGNDEPRLISDEFGPGCGLNGMDWGPDDRLYGPRWFHGEVARVDVDSGEVSILASGFQIPAAVKFDSLGRLHVLDTQAGEVVRVDLETGEKEVVGRPGVAKDNLAFDAEDRLFVSSFSDGSIVEVTGADTIREVIPGGINSPGGLAYVPSGDGSGRLFVADDSVLRTLDPSTGDEAHVVRGMFSDLGQAEAAHWSGEHLVLANATTVTLWNPDTDQLVARFEGFEEAIDAVQLGDDVIVSEFGSQSVLLFHTVSPDDRTVIASGLDQPAGLAVHGRDVYMADRSGTLLQLIDDGEPLATPRQLASGLDTPEGVAVTDDGRIYVVESGAGRVSHVDPDTGTVTPIAEGLALRGLERRALTPGTPVGFLNGITTGEGALFVSGYRDNIVYRIEL